MTKMLEGSVDAQMLVATDVTSAPPLACVTAALTSLSDNQTNARQLVGSLLHAITAISVFLDYGRAPFWTILRACERGLLSLLPRLANQSHADMDVHFREHLFTKGLLHAVRNENLEMAQWLCCVYCPYGFVWQVVEEAAGMGNVCILHWLMNRYRYTRIHPTLIDFAVKNGHFEAAKWIHTNIRRVTCSPATMAAVIKTGALQLVEWFVARYPEDPDQVFLYSAITTGNVELAGYLFYRGYQVYSRDVYGAAAQSGNLEMLR